MPPSDQACNIEFALGQQLFNGTVGARCRGPRSVVRYQCSGDLRRQQRISGCYNPYRIHEFFRSGVLQQEPTGPGPQCGEHVLVCIKCCEHQNSRGLIRVSQHVTGGIKSVDLWHSDIMSTTSGLVRFTTSTMPSPSSAVPTTSIPCCAFSRAAKPARIIAWSSTMSTRTSDPGSDEEGWATGED